MCFSATGSFAMSGVLAAVGAGSIARNSSKPRRMFAAIPLIFAAQQAAEGTVWLTMSGGHATLHRVMVAAFLGVALIVWPTWLSFALKLIETDRRRRRILGALFWAGAAVATYAAVFLVRSRPTAQIAGHSIRYEYATRADGPIRLLYLLAYAVPTVVPFFVSTIPTARTIGVMLVVSLVASVLVQRDALTSVWCFFAAILSCLILVAVARQERAHRAATASPSP